METKSSGDPRDPTATEGGLVEGKEVADADVDDESADIDFDAYTDEELVALNRDLERRNEYLTLENNVFESYMRRIAPAGADADGRGGDGAHRDDRDASVSAHHGSPRRKRRSNMDRRGAKSKGATDRAGGDVLHNSTGVDPMISRDKYLTLTDEQKSEVATREVEERRDECERAKTESAKTLDNVRAEIEEIELRAAEAKKAEYEFRRDVVAQAVCTRTGKIIAERVVRYYEDKIRAKDATIEKIRLKNATLKVQKNKLQLQLKQKEEMGEVLHAIDFDQLKIENQQYLMKIEERNQELLSLKMTAGNIIMVLNHYKKRLSELTAETAKVRSEISSHKDILSKLSAEMQAVNVEAAKGRELEASILRELERVRVPSVMDYVEQKALREEARKKLVSWERKVEIAEMSIRRLVGTRRAGAIAGGEASRFPPIVSNSPD